MGSRSSAFQGAGATANGFSQQSSVTGKLTETNTVLCLLDSRELCASSEAAETPALRLSMGRGALAAECLLHSVQFSPVNMSGIVIAKETRRRGKPVLRSRIHLTLKGNWII